MVLPQGAKNPSVLQVINGTDGDGKNAIKKSFFNAQENVSASIKFRLTDSSNESDVYMVAQDLNNNTQLTVTPLSVTTMNSMAGLTSKPINNFDFSTIPRPRLTSKPMTDPNFVKFEVTPREFTLSDGKVQIPIKLY